MRVPHLSPVAYRRVTTAAAVALAAIILTGAAVRLTGSGLGCPDWPTCDADRLVAPLEFHPMVEFVNRLVTGAVSVAVVLAVLGSLVRTPRRRELTWLSLGLVAGVVGQIVLGGITVLVDLHPAAVMNHFLLSMVLLANALVLRHRAGQPDGVPRERLVAEPSVRRAVAVVVGLAAVVLVAGTVVTGAGPHGGDEEARRFGFTPSAATRVHGLTVWALLMATLVLVWLVRRHQLHARLGRQLEQLLVAIVGQGIVGYLQYVLDVPAGLVMLHIAGAVWVWTNVVLLALSLDGAEAASTAALTAEPRPPAPPPRWDPSPRPAGASR